MRLTETATDAPPLDTRDRILDVAERMFAEYGFELTSLRALTTEAGVNLAAVHYHFGSKERLLEAVLMRLVAPVNAMRLSMLDALEADAAPPQLERLIEAFVGPPLRLAEGRSNTACLLLGRSMSSPDEQTYALIMRLFGSVIDRFVSAFTRALPHLPAGEVLWRMFFMLGVMTHTMNCGHKLTMVSDGRCDATLPAESIPRIVQFVATAMRAPAPSHESKP
jgi:AcrR family transcriptional regulator